MSKLMGISLIATLFIAISSFAFDNLSLCPDLAFSAQCVDGVWELKSPPLPAVWALTNKNGAACSVNGEYAEIVKWNYAAHSARLSAVFCNYSVLTGNNNDAIESVQIKSFSYIHLGPAWHNGGYPGYWVCSDSQEECTFLNQ